MKFATYILNLLYLLLLFSNCVQEFSPPAQAYQNLLVIEAFLSDSEEPFEVKLSRSIPIDTSGIIPEPGATVSLSDDSGESFPLQESEKPGVYVSQGKINPQVGRSYQIHVQTKNGNKYESSSVQMRDTPKLDSVSFRFEERPSEGVSGVQIFTNTHDPLNETTYYRWTWDESWVFSVPYDSYLIWDEGEIKERDERVNICWKFGRSTSIDIATTKNLNDDRISEYPLNFVNNTTDRLKLKYSVNVKQYSLSEESYNYWLELQKATESLGSLFDPQPSIIYGNIYNVNDENDVVLGYFDVSTVQEQRIFIKANEFPRTSFPNYYSYCLDSIVSPRAVPAMVDDLWWLVGDTEDPVSGFPAYLMSSLSCIDCTLYGTNEQPDYWE